MNNHQDRERGSGIFLPVWLKLEQKNPVLHFEGTSGSTLDWHAKISVPLHKGFGRASVKEKSQGKSQKSPFPPVNWEWSLWFKDVMLAWCFFLNEKSVLFEELMHHSNSINSALPFEHCCSLQSVFAVTQKSWQGSGFVPGTNRITLCPWICHTLQSQHFPPDLS